MKLYIYTMLSLLAVCLCSQQSQAATNGYLQVAGLSSCVTVPDTDSLRLMTNDF